jgi:phage baseplate assembly protein gpV
MSNQSVTTNWSVSERTYPLPHPDTVVTEFEFSNGVTIQYDRDAESLTIFLPTKESYESVGSEYEHLPTGGQIPLSITRAHGVPTVITIGGES